MMLRGCVAASRQLAGRPHSLALAARRAPPLQLVPPPSSLSLLQHDRGYKHVKGKHAPRVGEAKRAERLCVAARTPACSHARDLLRHAHPDPLHAMTMDLTRTPRRLGRAAARDLDVEGIYSGQITAQHGAALEVRLADGRAVRCKPAGRLKKGRIRLRIGDDVRVQYLMDVDEDLQTPTVVGRVDG